MPRRRRCREHGGVYGGLRCWRPGRRLGGALGREGGRWRERRGRRRQDHWGRLRPARRGQLRGRLHSCFLLGGLALLGWGGKEGAIGPVRPQRHRHVPRCRHDPHQGAGLVPRERPPHSLESGDVLVPPLEAEQRDLPGGPEVGPQGVPDGRGGHGLRAESGDLDGELAGG